MQTSYQARLMPEFNCPENEQSRCFCVLKIVSGGGSGMMQIYAETRLDDTPNKKFNYLTEAQARDLANELNKEETGI